MQLEEDRSLLLKQAEQDLAELSLEQLKIVVDLLRILKPQISQFDKRQGIIDFLDQKFDTIKSYGVTSLAIFGSVARDEHRPNSDIDILVEFADKVTFSQYMDLKFYLEDNFGKKVDLVIKKNLKPLLLSNIEKEAIYVA